jgi:hypothetical protein
MADIFKPHELTAVQVTAPDTYLWGAEGYPPTPPNTATPFAFVATCPAALGVCNKVADALQSAGTRIARAIKIKRTINVKVVLRSFCNGNPSCALANTLGRGSPVSFYSGFTGNNVSQSALYPSALLKQMHVAYDIPYADTDILVHINSDYPFWYPSDSYPIQPGQHDFEFVVAHEITHGMGLFSGWVYYKDLFPASYLQSNYLNTPHVRYLANGSWVFSQDTVFDLGLFSNTGVAIHDLNVNVRQATPDANFRVFVANFQTGGTAPFTAAQSAFSIFNSTELKYKVGSELINVHSPATWETGTNGIHLKNSEYSATSDVLLVDSYSYDMIGKSLPNVLASVGGAQLGPYGVQTLKILRNIGYKLRTDAGYPLFTLNYNVKEGPVFVGTGTALIED